MKDIYRFGLLALITSLFFGTACHKSNSGGGRKQDSTITNSPPSDSAVGILYFIPSEQNTYVYNRTPYANASIVLHSPSGTLLWRNDTITGPSLTDPAFDNGTLYFCGGIETYTDDHTGNPPLTTVQAVDSKTGRRIWSYRGQLVDSYTPYAFQNKVYWLDWEYAAIFDGTTGQITSIPDYYPNSPYAWQDSNMLYILQTAPGSKWNILSVNLSTAQTAGLSLLSYYTPACLKTSPDKVFIVTGGVNINDPGSNLVAMDKQRLQQLWVNNDHVYGNQVIIQDSVVYAFTNYGAPLLVAVNVADGQTLWQTALPTTVNYILTIYAYNGNIYACGPEDMTHSFVAGFDVKSHNITSYHSVADGFTGPAPVKCGNTLYGMRGHQVMAWDPATLQVRNSFPTQDSSVSQIYIISKMGKLLK